MISAIKKNLIPLSLSILGSMYVIYYIFSTSTDVVLSDYIRLVNNYIYDVTDLKYLFSLEAISRVPFCFLMRFINVKVFNYSVFFDKIVGVVGLFIFNFATIKYVMRRIKSNAVKITIAIVITFISFSLMSWEMILNGTGYAHFITIGLIAVIFNLLDKHLISNVIVKLDANDIVTNDNTNKKNYYLLLVTMAVTSILFAGSYAVAYLCTIIVFTFGFIVYLCVKLKGNSGTDRNVYFRYLINDFLVIFVSLLCLALYFISDSTGEPLVPVGFKEVTLVETLSVDPLFPVRFIVKSLASAIIGVETFDYAIRFGTITENMIYLFGLIYILIILWMGYITIGILVKNIIKHHNASDVGESYLNDIDRITFLPYMYIIYGLISLILVFLARYRFLDDTYGMTSRYAIQYMYLGIGIIIVLALYIDRVFYNYVEKLSKMIKVRIFVSIICIFIIFFGNVVTSTDEIWKAGFRKLLYENVENIARNYENYTDEELENYFEYHRDPSQIRNAFEVLKKQKLNVFKNN